MNDLNVQNERGSKLDSLRASHGGAVVDTEQTQGYSPQAKQNLSSATYRVPLREQIEKAHYGDTERAARLHRAHSILSSHPEFEEFLELQELINRGLFR